MKLAYKTVEEAPLLTKNRYREIKCIKMYQQLDVCCYQKQITKEVDYLVVGTTKCKIIQLLFELERTLSVLASKLVDLVVRGESEVSIIFSK